jgi:hypothetical protein
MPTAIRSTDGERQVSGAERSFALANPEWPVWAAADIRPTNSNDSCQSEEAIRAGNPNDS